MPDCPFLSDRNASSCFDQCSFCATPSRRFGRSKPWTMVRPSPLNSFAAMSARVALSAVAVKAAMRAAGNSSFSLRQLLVFRPEARPPLGDAMRLVHHEQLGIEPMQRRQHVLVHQPLGREIEQLGLARRRLAPFGDLLVAPHAGMDRGRLDAVRAQPGDLVVHQRLQRRDDDGRPLQQQGRDLVAQRLARSRSASPPARSRRRG